MLKETKPGIVNDALTEADQQFNLVEPPSSPIKRIKNIIFRNSPQKKPVRTLSDSINSSDNESVNDTSSSCTPTSVVYGSKEKVDQCIHKITTIVCNLELVKKCIQREVCSQVKINRKNIGKFLLLIYILKTITLIHWNLIIHFHSILLTTQIGNK